MNNRSIALLGNQRRKNKPPHNVFNRKNPKPESAAKSSGNLTYRQAEVRWRSNGYQMMKRMIEEENWPKHEGEAVTSIEIVMQRQHPISRSRATAVIGMMRRERRIVSLGYNERLGFMLYVVGPGGRAYYDKLEKIMKGAPPPVLPYVERKTRLLKQVMNEPAWVKLEKDKPLPKVEEDPESDRGTMLLTHDRKALLLPSNTMLRDHELKHNLPWLRERMEWQRSTHREPDSMAAWNSVSRVLGIRVDDLKKVWNAGKKKGVAK